MRGYRSTSEDYLFHKGDWHATQGSWRNELIAKIEAMNGDELLNVSTTDLARYYVRLCRILCLTRCVRPLGSVLRT